METEHPETVVEKTVAFVKDVLGIHSAPGPEYRETASEVTAENAMRLDPNEFALGEMDAEGYFPSTDNAGETDAERLRRAVDEHPREKRALAEKQTDNIKARLRDLVGLPPGDGTPHGKGASPEPDTVPEGGLTSPDAEGLNPHSGSGLQVER